MLFCLRFCVTALWLIVTALILPGFKPGGRYQILLMVFLAVSLVELGQYWFFDRFFRLRPRLLVSGLAACLGLWIGEVLFNGVRLTLAGLTLFYLGMVVAERLLDPLKRRSVYSSSSSK